MYIHKHVVNAEKIRNAVEKHTIMVIYILVDGDENVNPRNN